jgi:hypothetical protein
VARAALVPAVVPAVKVLRPKALPRRVTAPA